MAAARPRNYIAHMEYVVAAAAQRRACESDRAIDFLFIGPSAKACTRFLVLFGGLCTDDFVVQAQNSEMIIVESRGLRFKCEALANIHQMRGASSDVLYVHQHVEQSIIDDVVSPARCVGTEVYVVIEEATGVAKITDAGTYFNTAVDGKNNNT